MRTAAMAHQCDEFHLLIRKMRTAAMAHQCDENYISTMVAGGHMSNYK
jgi:hypothetical protein